MESAEEMGALHHVRPWRYAWLHVLLILGSLITLLPFLWMLGTSLKSASEVFSATPTFLPKAWRWENYQEVFQRAPFARFYWNTIVVTVARVAGQILLCSMAGYAFARLRFPGREALFLAVLAVLMLPEQVTLVPKYVLLKYLGWLDTYQGLIVPSLFSALGTFLLRQFFMTLPSDLDDAAVLDGCNPFQVYWHVALPLARPTILAFGLLVVLWSWNDFLWPLIVTSSTEMQVLSVGINYFQGQYVTNFAVMMAAATVATVPMLIVFIIVQNYLIEGIT